MKSESTASRKISTCPSDEGTGERLRDARPFRWSRVVGSPARFVPRSDARIIEQDAASRRRNGGHRAGDPAPLVNARVESMRLAA